MFLFFTPDSSVRNFFEMRLELQLEIFQIRLELVTFGCNSPNQPTRITHILLSKSACECDESYEKSPPANLSFVFATKSLLYQTIVNFNLFYYQVCATTIRLRSLFFILSPIITPILPHNNPPEHFVRPSKLIQTSMNLIQ